MQDEPAQQEQTVDVVDTAVAAADEPAAEQAAPSEEKPAKRTRKPRAKKKVEDTPDEGVEAVAEPAMSAETAVVEEVKPKRKRAPRKTKAQKEAEAAAAATEDGAGGSSADAEQTTESPAAPSQAANMQAPAEMADAPVEPSKSKKRGWWSIGK